MTHNPQILIHQLSYSTSDDKQLFNNLSLSFGFCKNAIIGKNGVGKSTLLKLIIGELPPEAGSVNTTGSIDYCPQNPVFCANDSVAKILGIEDKLQALERIAKGSVDEKDFTIVNDDWNIKEKAIINLEKFGLGYIELNRHLQNISGGELTRLLLAKAFLANPDFIIFDEPTNNLDINSRELLYDAIKIWKKGLIVVSHDRHLLNLMDQIIELTSIGANLYGGNYEHYVKQKELEQSSIQHNLQNAQKELKRTKQSIQTSREKLDERKKVGKKLRHTGSQTKLILNAMKARSEKTQSKLATREEQMLDKAKQKLQQAKEKIEIDKKINIELPKTKVPNNKIILILENIAFGYNKDNPPIIKNFNLVIKGPERVAITGKNGSGKTTLVKLIQEQLKPLHGSIKIGVSKISYLDQNFRILNDALSILDNLMQINPDIKKHDAQAFLAKFLFRGEVTQKIVKNLSGGEKLRAALTCILSSNEPPQLIILDEPTNYLDLDSIASLESALNCYQGAIIIISHDVEFIKNISVTKIIELEQ